ncbi:MAG: F0F1 ATP synthase subunit B [Spirochaetaceae bacterium]|jgi:F-type H+-transporting ATPase subunit b|nr:F0F1 ATP synthase subunit B [Spirochaetaceae bacterium]
MLDFSWVTFVVTLLNIGILYFILRAILFKPVTQFMEKRTKKIAEDIEQAEKDKNQAKALLQQYEDVLNQAKGEAALIIKNAQESARVQAGRIVADGKAQADAVIANVRLQAEAERNAALLTFKAEAAGLVISAASRLLRRELTQEDSRTQAALLLRELGKTP